MNKIAWTILLVASLTVAVPAAAADLTVTYQTKGGKKSGERIHYWSDKFNLSVDKANKMDTLTDYDQGVIYMIDHSKKLIEYMRFNDMTGMMGQSSQMMSQMMGAKMPGSKDTVGEKMQKNVDKMLGKGENQPLERLGKETIAGRSCDSYRVTRSGKSYEMIEEACIDITLVPPGEDTPAGANLEAMAGEMGGQLSGLQAAGQKELQGIKGLQLRRRMKSKTKGMMSVASFGMGKSDFLEVATEVKEGAIDPTVFKLPTGYKEVDKIKEMQAEMKDAMQKMEGMGIPASQ